MVANWQFQNLLTFQGLEVRGVRGQPNEGFKSDSNHQLAESSKNITPSHPIAGRTQPMTKESHPLSYQEPSISQVGDNIVMQPPKRNPPPSGIPPIPLTQFLANKPLPPPP